MVRALLPEGDFFEVFVDVPLEECIRRDPKGLYAKALRGEIPNFTGINSPYEQPEKPELVVAGAQTNVEDAVADIISRLGFT